jgi:cytochrome c biogenesis protein
MKSVWRLFSSIKLAIVLFIVLTLASILGTLIPQQWTPAEYQAHYGNLSRLVTGLDLDRLYQSAWFIGLLLLFGLNLVVCSLTRLTPKLLRTFGNTWTAGPGELVSLKIRDSFTKRSGLEAFVAAARTELGRRRFRVTAKSDSGRALLRARKHTLGLFGSDIVHLGVLVILAGGLVSGLGKYRSDISVSEGQTVPVPWRAISLRLDKFETEYYPMGAVKAWKSTVTIYEGGAPRLTRTIAVNHPLSYKEVVFYQSSYGWDWESPSLELQVKKKSDPAFLKAISLNPGGKAALDDGTEITAVRFLPDFVIGSDSEPATRTWEPNNPAVLIEGYRKDARVFSGWVFAKYPEFTHFRDSGKMDLAFELTSYKAPQFSVLQVASDPGAPVIWTGCILLMLGLFLSFYWPPREIKLILEAHDGPSVAVSAGGLAFKGRDRFVQEFATIMAVLRRTS